MLFVLVMSGVICVFTHERVCNCLFRCHSTHERVCYTGCSCSFVLHVFLLMNECVIVYCHSMLSCL